MSDYPAAGYWVGHPGALMPLPSTKGNLQRRTSRAVTFKTSAAGNQRAYMSARRAPFRVWSVSIPLARADEIAALQGLLMATEPPYVWVDPYAKVTNLLTPLASIMGASSPELPRLGRQPLVGGGFTPTAVANPSYNDVRIEPAPVVPGVPVTVSAYMSAGGDMTIAAVFLDSNAAPIETVTSSPYASIEALTRAHVTAVAPYNAAAVQIKVSGAAVLAQPAVTWTADLLEYGIGGGCNSVVIAETDEDVEQSGPGIDMLRLQSLSFTVTEVG